MHQLLRTNHAQQDDDAPREQKSHEHQQVTRAAGGKDVDEQQRACRANGHRDHREGNDRQRGRHVEAERRAARQADAEQHGRDEHDHHPRRLRNRPREPRIEQPPRGHGGRQQQPQIIGEEERRQRGDDATEGKECEERHENPRQAEAQQVVAQLVVVVELPCQPGCAIEQCGEYTGRDAAEEDCPREVAGLAPLRAVARRPEMRQQQVGEGALHTASSIS